MASVADVVAKGFALSAVLVEDGDQLGGGAANIVWLGGIAGEILDFFYWDRDSLGTLCQRLERILADLGGRVFFSKAQELDGKRCILMPFGEFAGGACRKAADVWEGTGEKRTEFILGARDIFAAEQECAFALLME